MYTYSLIYEDEEGFSWASAEDMAHPETGLLVWKDEWSDHPKGSPFIVARFREWAAEQGRKYRLVDGRH
jgi:hypothetical protein